MSLVGDMWISMGRSNKDFIDGQVAGRDGKRVSWEVERMKGKKCTERQLEVGDI